MFTGIIEDVGQLVGVSKLAGGVLRYRFRPGAMPCAELVLGESIAIDGCCLTVVSFDETCFEVEATPETMTRTTLGQRGRGDRVNLERATRLGDRLGGHIVTGHVDATGTLVARRPSGDAMEADFSFPEELGPFIVEKGSVTINGVSLTVNAVKPTDFTVYLIPFTLQETTFGDRPLGAKVNLETDLLGKYVVHALQARGRVGTGGVTEDLLGEHGFIHDS